MCASRAIDAVVIHPTISAPDDDLRLVGRMPRVQEDELSRARLLDRSSTTLPFALANGTDVVRVHQRPSSCSRQV